eukprot:COSAG01_NODE_8517_length_2756_cov_4.083553_4_plen_44_part_00
MLREQVVGDWRQELVDKALQLLNLEVGVEDNVWRARCSRQKCW